ncbi:ExbD/TolR family protein [Agaribacterium sp. ZY112]|uniref:ExbD/TolR family protein n=1 Tax=Agaribacterium sp. ZY112 TaxID=3233574 RepID=UPI0035242E1F
MSRRRRHKVESEDSGEIDLTPMLDVVFIMLIFFIVTASFVKEKSLGLNVPENNDVPPPPSDDTPKNILIQVTSNDDIYIDDRRVDVRAIRSLIAQKKAENPEASVIVRMHELSKANTYVAIADSAREAKIFNVNLVPYNE